MKFMKDILFALFILLSTYNLFQFLLALTLDLRFCVANREVQVSHNKINFEEVKSNSGAKRLDNK